MPYNPGGGGGAGVTSVNGDVGPAVVLDATEVGADPAGTGAAEAAAAVAAHVAAADPHPQYLTEIEADAFYAELFHAGQHENGGVDELNVAGLSGELADIQRVAIQDEGGAQGTAPTLNFTGAGVTASVAANVATINIPGASGAPVGASYVVIALDGTLTAERRLQIEAAVLSLTDGGANGDVTLGVAANGITYAKMQDVSATARFLGRITAGAGDPEELTGTQATTLLNVFTDTLKGLAPLSGGGTANFLRADGTWNAPTAGAGGANTQVQWNNAGALAGTAAITLNATDGALFAAGTATALSWPRLTAGTLLTTPEVGALELDANCLYGTTDAGNRGYIPIRHFTRCDSAFALQNVGTEQAMFPAAQDTLTLETGTYKFEGFLAFTGMSATSGNAAIDILGAGTATIGTWLWSGMGRDNAAVGAGTIGGTAVITQQSAASIVTASTQTELWVKVEGTFEVTAAGTIIPSITLLNASAASMRAGSYMMFERIGSTSAVSVGQWS